MNRTTAVTRPPEPDFEALTTAELIAYREAENRFRASDEARAIIGEPDPGAAIEWRKVALPGRDVPVRVYRPASTGDADAARTDLPLVVHVHGGSF
ncbi:alpha/beta hydrolase, partial [Streptomyces broussonetiae]